MTSFQYPYFAVQYNHSTIDDGDSPIDMTGLVLNVVTHHGYQADRGACEITCVDYPAGLTENDHLWVQLNGELVFNGRMARPAVRYYDTWVFSCEDIGANMAFLWGGEGTDPELDALMNRVYTSQTDDAIITNLAEAMAVPVSLHAITGAGVTMATIYDIVLRVGQAPWSLIRGDNGIDAIFGYWTATTNDGVLRRMPLTTAVSPDVTATEGDNIIGADRNPLGTESIINRYIVYGLEYEGGTIGGVGVGDYSLPNSNIPTPPTSHSATIRNNMIEDDAQALATATLQVGLHNFPYDETNITLLGDPLITIGQTVQIDSADLDHAGDLRFIAEVSHRYGVGVGFETQIKCIRTE